MKSVFVFLMSISIAPMALAAPTKFEVDAAHSVATFKVKHLGVSYFRGRFNEMEGVVHWDEKKPADSSVELKINVASVDTANEKRDTHLKGPDFFDGSQFPAITFKSKSVKKVSKDTLSVTGDLQMRGVTKTVVAQVKKIGEGKDPWGGYRMGFDTELKLKRSDYGMKFMLDGLSDEVTIQIGVEGVQK